MQRNSLEEASRLERTSGVPLVENQENSQNEIFQDYFLAVVDYIDIHEHTQLPESISDTVDFINVFTLKLSKDMIIKIMDHIQKKPDVTLFFKDLETIPSFLRDLENGEGLKSLIQELTKEIKQKFSINQMKQLKENLWKLKNILDENSISTNLILASTTTTTTTTTTKKSSSSRKRKRKDAIEDDQSEKRAKLDFAVVRANAVGILCILLSPQCDQEFLNSRLSYLSAHQKIILNRFYKEIFLEDFLALFCNKASLSLESREFSVSTGTLTLVPASTYRLNLVDCYNSLIELGKGTNHLIGQVITVPLQSHVYNTQINLSFSIFCKDFNDAYSLLEETIKGRLKIFELNGNLNEDLTKIKFILHNDKESLYLIYINSLSILHNWEIITSLFALYESNRVYLKFPYHDYLTMLLHAVAHALYLETPLPQRFDQLIGVMRPFVNAESFQKLIRGLALFQPDMLDKIQSSQIGLTAKDWLYEFITLLGSDHVSVPNLKLHRLSQSQLDRLKKIIFDIKDQAGLVSNQQSLDAVNMLEKFFRVEFENALLLNRGPKIFSDKHFNLIKGNFHLFLLVKNNLFRLSHVLRIEYIFSSRQMCSNQDKWDFKQDLDDTVCLIMTENMDLEVCQLYFKKYLKKYTYLQLFLLNKAINMVVFQMDISFCLKKMHPRTRDKIVKVFFSEENRSNKKIEFNLYQNELIISFIKDCQFSIAEYTEALYRFMQHHFITFHEIVFAPDSDYSRASHIKIKFKILFQNAAECYLFFEKTFLKIQAEEELKICHLMHWSFPHVLMKQYHLIFVDDLSLLSTPNFISLLTQYLEKYPGCKMQFLVEREDLNILLCEIDRVLRSESAVGPCLSDLKQAFSKLPIGKITSLRHNALMSMGVIERSMMIPNILPGEVNVMTFAIVGQLGANWLNPTVFEGILCKLNFQQKTNLLFLVNYLQQELYLCEQQLQQPMQTLAVPQSMSHHFFQPQGQYQIPQYSQPVAPQYSHTMPPIIPMQMTNTQTQTTNTPMQTTTTSTQATSPLIENNLFPGEVVTESTNQNEFRDTDNFFLDPW